MFISGWEIHTNLNMASRNKRFFNQIIVVDMADISVQAGATVTFHVSVNMNANKTCYYYFK